jgi:hypothetical protein
MQKKAIALLSPFFFALGQGYFLQQLPLLQPNRLKAGQ